MQNHKAYPNAPLTKDSTIQNICFTSYLLFMMISSKKSANILLNFYGHDHLGNAASICPLQPDRFYIPPQKASIIWVPHTLLRKDKQQFRLLQHKLAAIHLQTGTPNPG